MVGAFFLFSGFHIYLMKRLFYILPFLFIPFFSVAQLTSGNTGLLNVPSAEMQKDGSFVFGGNYLPEDFTPDYFSYNTGNYFLNLTMFSFFEVTYRCTLMKMKDNGKYHNQDRSFSVRGRLLEESTWLPAVVVGGNDLFSSTPGKRDVLSGDTDIKGNRFYRTVYGVATKHLKWADSEFGFTVGSGFSDFNNGHLDGVFGGVSWSPWFAHNLSLIGEYDSNVFNTGATLLLWDHLYLQGFMHDMKNFVGGVAYKITLGGRRKK
ncbi:hypothetical protein EYV94_07910 [Puteibacter caeruleilacunae]|nr:hypothetical protein EYV94_07910 [Puteibacter caeruleilacunae]